MDRCRQRPSQPSDLEDLLQTLDDGYRRIGLAQQGVGEGQAHGARAHDHVEAELLREVKETLGTVTERLQQILQTVRRDIAERGRYLDRLSEVARNSLGEKEKTS